MEALGGLYTLPVMRPVALLSSRASADVWHDRLGHPHSRALSRVLRSCSVANLCLRVCVRLVS